MKLPVILSSLAMTTTCLVAATTVPFLSKIDTWGFINLDLDGVLRSWASNGTVLEATPLDPDQIAAFIALREGIVEPQRTENEKLIFAHINGLDVPASQLLNPPDDMRPEEEIAKAQSSKLALGGVLPLPEKDTLQARACVPAYCYGPNSYCVIYVGCEACYGSVCRGLYGGGK